MSRFTDGLKIIPRTAWVIGAVCYLGVATLALTVFIPGDKEMKYWPLAGKLAIAYGMFLFAYAWVLLIGYVYADAKRRGMRYAMWMWLAALIPNGIGIIIYFILRDALPRPCPGCSSTCKIRICFLPILRNRDEAHLSQLRPSCGARVDELSGVRFKTTGRGYDSSHGVAACGWCGENRATTMAPAALASFGRPTSSSSRDSWQANILPSLENQTPTFPLRTNIRRDHPSASTSHQPTSIPRASHTIRVPPGKRVRPARSRADHFSRPPR